MLHVEKNRRAPQKASQQWLCLRAPQKAMYFSIHFSLKHSTVYKVEIKRSPRQAVTKIC